MKVQERPTLKYRIVADDRHVGDTQFYSEAWCQVTGLKKKGKDAHATEIRLASQDSEYASTGIRIKV